MSLVYANRVMCACVRACFMDALFAWQGPMEEQCLYWMALPCINIFENKNKKNKKTHHILWKGLKGVCSKKFSKVLAEPLFVCL